MASLRVPKKCKSEGTIAGLCGGRGRTVRLSSVIAACFQTCLVVRCCVEGLQQRFVRSNSPETLLQGFKGLNVQIWANGLTTWYSIYQNLPFRIPKNSGYDCPCWSSLKPLLKRSWMMPFHWLSFCLRFKVLDPCFIPSDDPWQKSFTISLVTGESLTTLLSAHLCDSRLGFVEPNDHTHLNTITQLQAFWL
jgi:hypothetical protein